MGGFDYKAWRKVSKMTKIALESTKIGKKLAKNEKKGYTTFVV